MHVQCGVLMSQIYEVSRKAAFNYANEVLVCNNTAQCNRPLIEWLFPSPLAYNLSYGVLL